MSQGRHFTAPRYDLIRETTDQAYHLEALEHSHAFIQCVIKGNDTLVYSKGISIEAQFRFLRDKGILTTSSTYRKLKRGAYKSISVVVLQYLASYHNLSIIDLYYIGSREMSK